MSWLQEAKKLKLGDSTYIPHEGCTTSNKQWVYHSSNGWGSYCNKCGEKHFKGKGIRPIKELSLDHVDDKTEFFESLSLPEDTTYNIDSFPLEAKVWLYKSDIRDKMILDYGIGYSKDMHRVIIPVYDEYGSLLMWQGRGLLDTQTKYFNARGSGKSGYFFKSWIKHDDVEPHTMDSVVVVEDALSVIKVGKVAQAVAGLGTSLSQKQLTYLSNFDKVYLWYDDDKGGLNGSTKSLRSLSLVTDCTRIRTDRDPKSYSYYEIQGILKNLGG